MRRTVVCWRHTGEGRAVENVATDFKFAKRGGVWKGATQAASL